MKRFFLSACVSALLLGIAPASAHADTTDPEMYFYPAQGWSIDYMETQSSGAPTQTCFLSSTFNNGFIVQFTGSDKWVDTMEIDFQQPLFPAGGAQTVSLSVPGVNAQDISAQASSETTLSISLRAAEGFYKDMRGSSVLDFSLGENNFRFYMVGLATAAEEFEKCMTGSTVVAKTGYQPPDVAPEPAQIPESAGPTYQPQHEETAPVKLPKPLSKPDTPHAEALPETMPTMQVRRGGRKRMSEMLAEEMARNPDIAAVPPETRPDQMVYEQEQAVPDNTAPPVLDAGIDAPAINWEGYDPDANSNPGALIIPPGYHERP